MPFRIEVYDRYRQTSKFFECNTKTAAKKKAKEMNKLVGVWVTIHDANSNVIARYTNVQIRTH